MTNGLILTRRMLGALAATSAAFAAHGEAAGDPLPSWNDGPAKRAILDFLRTITDSSNASFVPPAQRIATFDQDGTLWVEHPMYTQVVYCLDRVPAVVAERPELKQAEPFKTVLTGDQEAIARLPFKDLDPDFSY